MTLPVVDGMSVARIVDCADDCSLRFWNKQAEYQKDLLRLVRRFDGQPLPDLSLSLRDCFVCLVTSISSRD